MFVNIYAEAGVPRDGSENKADVAVLAADVGFDDVCLICVEHTMPATPWSECTAMP